MKTGPFQNRSYFGYKGNVLKSGICKYYRRGIFDKFEWCIVEMLLFGLKSNALVTNLINRLRILIMEELVFNEYDIISSAIEILNKAEKTEGLMDKLRLLVHFCEIVKHSKRARLVSYVKNWWNKNSNTINLDDVVLDKVLIFKKENDSDEMLKLGELLIHCNDESMIDIYLKMSRIEGKYGNRYRRKDAVYLFWEIIETRFKNKLIFDFAFNMFKKKNMERFHYGVWICLMIIYGFDDTKKIVFTLSDINIDEYLKNRKQIKIDEYVVNDWHVNKNYGLDVFAKVGAFVTDEDVSILGDNGNLYKDFYIKTKEETAKNKTKTKQKLNTFDKLNTSDNIKHINFDEFEIKKVFDDSVCGLKKCCILVNYNDKIYVLKEMGKGLQYGKHYECIDKMKDLFGVTKLNVERIISNKTMIRKDKSIRTFGKGNWDFETKENVYYCMMDFIDYKGYMSKTKDILNDINIQKELIKIRLFDGLFRSSDNNMRNILVTKDNNLVSIDEGDLFGKRKHIFDKNDYCIKYISKSVFEEVIENMKKVNKDTIIKILTDYGFNNNLQEFNERFNNYRDIVFSEL